MSRHTLRHKLIAIFVLLALLVGISGAVGLHYVNRISSTVNVFTETTSPMLKTMTELIGNALHIKIPVFAGVNEGATINELTEQRDAVHALAHRQIARLKRQVARAGIDVRVDEAERLESALSEALHRMIHDYEHARSAQAELRRIHASLKATFAETDRRLQDLIGSAEADIAVVEERTKIEVEMGRMADDLDDVLSDLFNVTYQVLEKSRWLSRLLKEIEDTATLARDSPSPKRLDLLRQEVKQTFKGTRNVLDRLAGRLASPDERRQLDELRAGIGDLERDMMGPGGLIARRGEVLAAQTALEAGRQDVLGIERAYFELLEGVRFAVSNINADAQRSAEASIAEAKIAFAACLLIALAAAVFLAHTLARGITRPLSRLTCHVAKISKSGHPEPLLDPEEVDRKDEIGTLTRAFNAMIDDLAQARRALIAQSEEEVRVQYERLDAAISNMPQGLSMFDRDRRLVVCNARYAELYQLSEEHTRPGTPFETLLEILMGRCSRPLTDGMPETIAEAVAQFDRPHFGIFELKDGRTVAVSRLPTPDGGALSTHEDITERRRAEEKIAHMAMHDMLTELPNRVAFRESLDAALARMARGGEDIAVLYFDLDHFKNVNDTLGHPVGDALLKAVAQRLAACVRETDTVARLGGDEFAIVQADLHQPSGAAELASRLVAELSRPYEIEGQQVVIGASVGIALAPTDGTDPDTLLRNADMALYRSKELGRGTFSFFEADMDARMQARRALELELRQAFAEEEFALYYQPLVNARTGKVGGFEALLRWDHRERGLIPPAAFLPLAEETGLITELGAWVLREACRAAANWPRELRVAVNLAPAQFANGRILDDVRAALHQSGLAPARLELEITETMLIRDTGATVAMLERLHGLGVRVSMDDFGTGHSSLGYLRKFAFDRIKIDRSFVRDLDHSRDALAIVRAVNGLAAALGIDTVAEGVETGEQLASARSEGCSEIQGELFSGPVPLSEVAALIHRQFGQREGADASGDRNAA